MGKPQIEDLILAGALFVINHSAGKDSQAMALFVRDLVPDEQILVVHADLGDVEWPGNIDHIRNTTAGLHLEVCRNPNKTFFEMVRHRGMWPSPSTRQCTSDLKRGPIERTIRHYLKDNPHFGGLVVNCMGIRAEESPARGRQKPFRHNPRNSKAGREWFDWLPIFDWSKEAVFTVIREADQKPHWLMKRVCLDFRAAFVSWPTGVISQPPLNSAQASIVNMSRWKKSLATLCL